MPRFGARYLVTVTWRHPSQNVLDLAAAAVLLVLALVEVWGWGAMAVIVATAGTAPVAWRNRYPLLCLLTILGSLAVLTAWGSDRFAVAHLAALMLATYTVAAKRSPPVAWVGLALALGSAWLNSARADIAEPGDYIFPVLLLGTPWAAGLMLRAWRARAHELQRLTQVLSAERDARAELAVVVERGRIARDLHDSLAQSLHIVVLHAEAAEEALDHDRRAAVSSLHRIQEVGRASLDDTRRLLGFLRTQSQLVQPSLRELDHLIDGIRSEGLEVNLCREGALDDLPSSIDVASYRIIQEGLTNVLKHARAGHAVVSLERAREGLEIDIVDDGQGRSREATAGYGLLGMAERASALGGSLVVGDADGRGFRVHASLPIGSAR